MGTTISNLGPQVGQAAGGYVQGREARTREDTSRQSIALAAAQEGRQKEQHRLNIQQLGLQIQGMMQAQDQAEKMFGPQLAQAERGAAPVGPDVLGGLNQIPGVNVPEGDVLPAEAFKMAQMGSQGYRAEQANRLGYSRLTTPRPRGPQDFVKELKILEDDALRKRNLHARIVAAMKKARGKDLVMLQSQEREYRFAADDAETEVKNFRQLHPELGAALPDVGGSQFDMSQD